MKYSISETFSGVVVEAKIIFWSADLIDIFPQNLRVSSSTEAAAGMDYKNKTEIYPYVMISLWQFYWDTFYLKVGSAAPDLFYYV